MLKNTLFQKIKNRKKIKLMEAHSPLCARIIESTVIKKSSKQERYDGFWSSSFSDSALLSMPDTEFLSIEQRLQNIKNISYVSDMEFLMDIDTGGNIQHLLLNLKKIQKHKNIAGIIIEDKIGYKQNSIYGNNVFQKQAPVELFSEKLSFIKNDCKDNFLLIARIESLILGESIDTAIERAKAYLKAGANAIMIHDNVEHANNILKFSKKFKKLYKDVPLICVPTTFVKITDVELYKAGYDIIIYANHMIRSSFKNMSEIARKILLDGNSDKIEKNIVDMKKILNFVENKNDRE